MKPKAKAGLSGTGVAMMEVSRVQQFHPLFPKIKSHFDERASGYSGLICKQGFYHGCPVLYFQRASWTNDRMDQLKNETGIFFSIWMDEKTASKNRAHYNIHALKLRKLAGYKIASRDFANDFRSRFVSARSTWPNVSVDYGPLTLMQGWIETELNTFEADALVLIEKFEHLAPQIDRLLELRRK